MKSTFLVAKAAGSVEQVFLATVGFPETRAESFADVVEQTPSRFGHATLGARCKEEDARGTVFVRDPPRVQPAEAESPREGMLRSERDDGFHGGQGDRVERA